MLPMRIVVLLLIGLGVQACQRDVPARSRVTIIGIDGATWRVIDPLLAAGELPHMRALIEGGVRTRLRSKAPLVSPAVWTTIATGVFRKRHGILRFFSPSRDLFASTDRKVPALWNVASQAGLRSAVIGWWATYPAETINGAVISERALKIRESDVQDLGRDSNRAKNVDLQHLVSPPEVMDLVVDLVAAAPAETGQPHTPEAVVPRMRTEDAAVARSLLRLRKHQGPFDLEMILLRGVDPVSHYFWKYHEPEAEAYGPEERPSADDIATHGQVIKDHYRYVDTLLGELDARGSRDHVVLLISDHGFEAGHQKFHHGTLSGTHESEAAIHGILVAAGGPFRAGAHLDEASIADVTPTVLHALALPVAADLEGRVLTEAFSEGWLTKHPIREVPHFETTRQAPQAPGAKKIDERLHDELRALGYVE